jgi:hypothetical protein
MSTPKVTAPVKVLNPDDGTISSIGADQLADFLSAGFKPVTPEMETEVASTNSPEAAQRRLFGGKTLADRDAERAADAEQYKKDEEKYGGVGGRLIAAASGAGFSDWMRDPAQAASRVALNLASPIAGVADYIAHMAGKENPLLPPQTPILSVAEEQKYRSQNPVTTGLSSAVVDTALLAASAGLGTAGLAERIAARVGGGAVGAAVGRAAIGALEMEGLTTRNIYNEGGLHPMAPEAILQQYAINGLLGGAIPGVLSLSGSALKYGVERGMPALGRLYASTVEGLGIASKDAVTNTIDNIRSGKVWSTAAEKAADVTRLSDAFGEMGNTVNTINRNSEQVLKAQLGFLASTAKPQEVFNQLADLNNEMNITLDRIKGAAPGTYDAGWVRTLDNTRAQLNELAPLVHDPAAAFAGLREIKQRLQGELGDSYKAMWRLSHGKAEIETVGEIKDIAGKLNEALRDPAVWGPAAPRIASHDAAVKEMIEASKELAGKGNVAGQLPGAGLVDMGKISGEFIPSTKKINTFLNQVGDVRADARWDALEKWHTAAEKLLADTKAGLEMIPGASTAKVSKDLIEGAEGLIQRNKQNFAEVAGKAEATSNVNQIFGNTYGANPIRRPSAAGDLAGIGGAGAVGHYIGSALGVPGLGVLSAVAKAATKVVETVRDVPGSIMSLIALEKSAQKFAKVMTNGVVQAFGSVAGRVAVAEATKSYADRVTDYRKITDRIRTAASNPDIMEKNLSAATSGLHQDAPQTAQAVTIAGARAIAFLASKLPPEPAPGLLDAMTGKRRDPSAQEMSKFDRYLHTAKNPKVALDAFKHGMLTPEHWETLNTLYPKAAAHIREETIAQVTKAKGVVPPHLRNGTELILGTPLRANSLAVTAAIQQMYAARAAAKQNQQEAQAKPSRKMESKVSDRMSLQPDRVKKS